MQRLPRIYINGHPYFLDLRLKECRAIDNPHERLRLAELPDVNAALFWFKEIQHCVGKRVVDASVCLEDGEWFPVLDFNDGTQMYLLSDEEGNGPGRFGIECA